MFTLYIIKEYRGNVKWNNDWISFINGVFTFIIHKSMENNDSPADITSIRHLCIDPSKFQNMLGKGTYQQQIFIIHNLSILYLHLFLSFVLYI